MVSHRGRTLKRMLLGLGRRAILKQVQEDSVSSRGARVQDNKGVLVPGNKGVLVPGNKGVLDPGNKGMVGNKGVGGMGMVAHNMEVEV